MASVHVRYDSQSIDMQMSDLDIGDASTDTQIRAAVASALGVPSTKLASFVIDRNAETSDMTLRPQAVFG